MPIPNNYSTPIRLTAKNRAFNQMLEWIIEGTLQPNEKLNDTELAHALGVSRTPVREALQILDYKGFVETHRGVGTQVTPINNDDICNILPPLAVLQGLATEIAAQRINQQTIDELREINSLFERAVLDGDTYQALKLDEEFHQKIVNVCDNTYISKPISTLQSHVRRLYFHNSIILTEGSIDEHERILQAFENGDKELASKITRENILKAIDLYFEK